MLHLPDWRLEGCDAVHTPSHRSARARDSQHSRSRPAKHAVRAAARRDRGRVAHTCLVRSGLASEVMRCSIARSPKGPPLATPCAVVWKPDRPRVRPAWPVPPLFTALSRGLACRCPGCGATRLFRRYLKVAPVCAGCGAPLGLARADDAPPYFTIL